MQLAAPTASYMTITALHVHPTVTLTSFTSAKPNATKAFADRRAVLTRHIRAPFSVHRSLHGSGGGCGVPQPAGAQVPVHSVCKPVIRFIMTGSRPQRRDPISSDRVLARKHKMMGVVSPLAGLPCLSSPTRPPRPPQPVLPHLPGLGSSCCEHR